MVRNVRAVRKTGSCGTRRIFGSIRCKKQASTVRKRYSVPKTASSGTRRIFKGPQTADSTDCGQPPAHRTHLQRRAVPKAAPAAPDAFSKACRAKSSTCRTGRIFSARNGPRSLCSLRPIPLLLRRHSVPETAPLGGEQT